DVPRRQECRPAAAPHRWQLGAVPPPDLGTWRGCVVVTLLGPQELAIARTRDEPPAGRLVGLCSRGHGSPAARDRARLARGLPRRAPDGRGRPVPRGPGAAGPRGACEGPAAL